MFRLSHANAEKENEDLSMIFLVVLRWFDRDTQKSRAQVLSYILSPESNLDPATHEFTAFHHGEPVQPVDEKHGDFIVKWWILKKQRNDSYA